MSALVGKCCRSARRNHQCVNGQVALVVVPGAVDLDSGACGAEVTLSWLSTGGWTTGGGGWNPRRAQQPTRGCPESTARSRKKEGVLVSPGVELAAGVVPGPRLESAAAPERGGRKWW